MQVAKLKLMSLKLCSIKVNLLCVPCDVCTDPTVTATESWAALLSKEKLGQWVMDVINTA